MDRYGSTEYRDGKYYMWAHHLTDVDGDTFYMNFGDKWWVDLHGLGDPVVQVALTGDPKGAYFGWLEVRKGYVGDDVKGPGLILRKELFEIQFPYGSKAEVEAGRGFVKVFTVEEVRP